MISHRLLALYECTHIPKGPCQIKITCFLNSTFKDCAWNRLVPIAVALFRYLMICHAVFSQNLGGDRYVLKFIKIGLVFFSIGSGIVGVLGSVGVFSDSFEYLRCLGRQEDFRSLELLEAKIDSTPGTTWTTFLHHPKQAGSSSQGRCGTRLASA